MKLLNRHGALLKALCSWMWPEVTRFVYIRFVGMSRLLLLSLLAAVGASVPSGNSSQGSTEAPRNSTGHSFGSFLGTELPVLQRAFYVLSGMCLIGVVYCTVRSVRLRKPERKKYGLLANYDENMEMASVDSDEDTVFESKMLRR